MRRSTFFGMLCIVSLMALAVDEKRTGASTPRSRVPNAITMMKVGDRAPEELKVTENRVGVVAFTFPSGASQGPKEWYVLRLHARVDLGRRADGPIDLITVSTGRDGEKTQWAAAQIEIRQILKNGRSITDVSSVGLVDGMQHFRTSHRVVEIDFANYLQLRGVKPGTSKLTFDIEGIEKPSRIRMAVLPDTEILKTTTPPPLLRLKVQPLAGKRLTVGDDYAIAWRLANESALAARDVRVYIEDVQGDIEVLGETGFSYKTVTSPVKGEFRVRPRRAGQANLYLRVASANGGQPAVAINAMVHSDKDGDTAENMLLRGLGVLLVGMVITVAITVRLRKTRRARREIKM